MVNNSSRWLNTVFLALTDPTRRAILERLAREASGTELAQPFWISSTSVLSTTLENRTRSKF